MKNGLAPLYLIIAILYSSFFIFHSLFFILYFPVSSPKSVALVLPVMRTCTVSPM